MKNALRVLNIGFVLIATSLINGDAFGQETAPVTVESSELQTDCVDVDGEFFFCQSDDEMLPEEEFDDEFIPDEPVLDEPLLEDETPKEP